MGVAGVVAGSVGDAGGAGVVRVAFVAVGGVERVGVDGWTGYGVLWWN